MNVVTLAGNIGKDATHRDFANDKSVSEFSMATRGYGRDAESDWHNIQIWNAKGLQPYFVKGQYVIVTGRIKTEKYEKNGETRYMTRVVCNASGCELGGSRAADSGSSSPNRSYEQPRQQQPKPPAKTYNDHDIPF